MTYFRNHSNQELLQTFRAGERSSAIYQEISRRFETLVEGESAEIAEMKADIAMIVADNEALSKWVTEFACQ